MAPLAAALVLAAPALEHGRPSVMQEGLEEGKSVFAETGRREEIHAVGSSP
jgi:hypothetical protein